MSEIYIWLRWRQKYGPHNPVRMFEQPAGIIAWQIGLVNGVKDKVPADYMIYGKKPEPDSLSGDELIAGLEKTGKVKYGR